MFNKNNNTIVCFWIFISSCFSCFSQVNWIKYPQNPVMVKQNILSEFYAIGQPAVIIENDTFKMWYVACGIDHKGRVLHATSTDGVNWAKYGNGAIVMDVDSSGSWDDTWLDTPEIVHGPNGYLLYFFGDSVTDVPPGPNVETTSALGVATSPDGIHWTRYAGNPILTKGDSASWENFWIESPAVLYDSVSNQYMMWYSGVNKNWLIQTGLATSSDGLNWTKYAGNPVITFGSTGTYDDMWVAVPSVIKRNNKFEMWYSSFNSIAAWDTIYICYASSTDGISWTKYAENPLFHTYTPPSDTIIDKNGPWACDVVFDSNSNNYKMWYETAAGFCFATSTNTVDLENFEFSNENDYIVYPNPNLGNFIIETIVNNICENKYVEIYSAIGQLISKSVINNFKEKIDISDIPAGVYIVKIKNNTKSKIIKIIKQ